MTNQNCCPLCGEKRIFWGDGYGQYYCGYSKSIGGESPCGNKQIVEKLYKLSFQDRAKAIDFVMDVFDDNLKHGKFIECDLLMELIEIDKIELSIGVSILGISIWSSKLKKRTDFYDKLFNHCWNVKGLNYSCQLLEKYK